MNRRTARIVLNLDVELAFGERTVFAVSQDVTPFGMFIRLDEPLPLGTTVELTRRRAQGALWFNRRVAGPSPVRYARVGGVSLAYQTWGDGPVTIVADR